MIILWLAVLFVLINMVLALGLGPTIIILIGGYLFLCWLADQANDEVDLKTRLEDVEQELRACKKKLRGSRRRR